MMGRTRLLTLSLLATLGVLSQGTVQAAEITVLAGMGNVSGIQDLAPAFERASGHKVIVRFVPTADLPRVIEANTPADVLTAGPQAIDEYIAKGRVLAGSRVDFGKAGVGVSVKAGAPKAPCRSCAGARRLPTRRRIAGTPWRPPPALKRPARRARTAHNPAARLAAVRRNRPHARAAGR